MILATAISSLNGMYSTLGRWSILSNKVSVLMWTSVANKYDVLADTFLNFISFDFYIKILFLNSFWKVMHIFISREF
jgi:hypothetical protein